MPIGCVTLKEGTIIPGTKTPCNLTVKTLHDSGRTYFRISEIETQGKLVPAIAKTPNNMWLHRLEPCEANITGVRKGSVTSAQHFKELVEKGLIVWINSKGALETFPGLKAGDSGAVCQYILKVDGKPLPLNLTASIGILDSDVRTMKPVLEKLAAHFDVPVGTIPAAPSVALQPKAREERKDSKTSAKPIG